MKAFLVELMPEFEKEFEDENLDEMSNHGVMLLFGPFFGANYRSFSERQLRRLGQWLSDAVAEGGAIENAVSTCFLEHAHQMRISKVLTPYLSTQARRQFRA